MAHTYEFNPPVRCRGGPVLKLRLGDPSLEPALGSRILRGPHGPFRMDLRVENLLDDIAFRVKPATSTDAMLIVSLGLSGGRAKFEFSRSHTHNTVELMSPDVLLKHSGSEGDGNVVQISVMEEMRVLAVSLLRELGFTAYLSTIKAADGANLSGIVILTDDLAHSFIISGNHPAVSRLTVFDDTEVVDILRLLRARNGLRLLFEEVRDSEGMTMSDRERYRSLLADFASGAATAHHLVNLVEDVFLAFAARFPELARAKDSC